MTVPSLKTLRYVGCPSASEARELEATVAQDKRDLATLESTISQLQDALSHLKSHRRTLGARVERCTSMLAPVRRLPPELLVEIFTHTLDNGDGFVEPNPNQGPLLVSQVCSAWRAVALSTPYLWSSISLTFTARDEWRETPLSWRIRTMRTWIRRSGNFPLSVRLQRDLSENFDLSRRVAPDFLKDTIIPHIHRVRHLDVSMPSMHLEPLNNIPKGAVPLLETVSVSAEKTDWRNRMPYTEPLTLHVLYRSAPRLRDVELELCFDRVPSDLPFHQLRRLVLRPSNSNSFSVADCLDILSKCPKLTECEIHVSHESRSSWTGSPLTLPNLRHLGLYTRVEFDGLLDNITAPNLRSFRSTHVGSHGGFWNQSAFIRFLTRSRCALESLQFDSTDMTEPELLDTLRHTPELVDLNISAVEGSALGRNDGAADQVTNMLIEAMTYDQDGDLSSCLVPRLESLALHGHPSCTPEALAEMIRSRWEAVEEADEEDLQDQEHHNHVARLKDVHVAMSYRSGRSAVRMLEDKLEDCTMEGLRLEAKPYESQYYY